VGVLSAHGRAKAARWSLRAAARFAPTAAVLLFLIALVSPLPIHAQEISSPSRDELQRSLRAACEVRMQELKREGQRHLAAVKWTQDATGVRGEYIDYSPDYTCAVTSSDGTTPVGRMRYQEIDFEKHGDDVGDAMQSDPNPLRIEEVTQVFVYRHGIWE
jgi:hypothetical protein